MTTADSYTIDGARVSKEAFEAFEQSLKDKKEGVMCAETPTGGFSTYEGTAPNGARYRVKNESKNGHTLNEASALP